VYNFFFLHEASFLRPPNPAIAVEAILRFGKPVSLPKNKRNTIVALIS
jgi:hypothetical protein